MSGSLLSLKGASYNGGKAQINLWGTAGYIDNWAINVCKQQAFTFQGADSSNVLLTNQNWRSLINDRGYPTGMPVDVGAKWVSSQLYIYGVANDVWVLDWPGDTATMSLTLLSGGGGLTENIISSTRREYTITGSPTNTLDAGVTTIAGLLVSLRITAVTSLSNIRLYRKNDEALLSGSDATSYFTPEFLNRVKQFGVIRFMDWAAINATRIVKWAHRSVLTDYMWGGAVTKGSWWYGTATQGANNAYTVPNSLPSLTHGEVVQFAMPARPNVLTVSSVSKGSPTTLNFSTTHGLTTGDKVQADFDAVGGPWLTAMGTKSSSTGVMPNYVATVTGASSITIPLDSTAFADPVGTFRIHPTPSITDGSTSKICRSKELNLYFNSEWSGTYPRTVTAIYDANFDCFLVGGANSGDIFQVGVPWEVMISLCNYANCHPYFNLPYLADDDHITQHATLVNTTLRKGLIPRNSPGNEVWNTGGSFWSTSYAASNASRLYSSASSNLDYARRVSAVADLLRAVYTRPYKMIMEMHGVDATATTRFEGNSTINGGASSGYPINKCDAIAYGPYIYTPFVFAANPTTYTGFVDQVDNYVQGSAATAFDWMLAELTTPSNNAYGNTDQALDGWVNVYNALWLGVISRYSGRYGTLDLYHYEGGNGIAGPNSISRGGFPAVATSGRTITAANVQAFYYAFLASSQAATLMTNYLTRMAAAGVKFPSQYTISGSWSLDSTWGAQRLNDFAASATPQYTALLNWNNS
jgi:hypothetical protein